MKHRWRCLLLLTAAMLCPDAPGHAQGLTPEELASAARIDALTVPSPGELMAALSNHGKPNWQQYYREPIPTAYTSRAQLALNLGGLIADGYIAIEARDSQQVKNIGRDVMAVAKALGISDNIVGRGGSITQLAEDNEWTTLQEELEATQNEVKLAMEDQKDEELVVLVTLGGWIRGTEAVSAWIAENHTPEAGKLLRQPGAAAFFRARLAALPQKVQEERIVNRVSDQLRKIEEFVSFSPDAAPSQEDVQRIKTWASDLVAAISTK